MAFAACPTGCWPSPSDSGSHCSGVMKGQTRAGVCAASLPAVSSVVPGQLGEELKTGVVQS